MRAPPAPRAAPPPQAREPLSSFPRPLRPAPEAEAAPGRLARSLARSLSRALPELPGSQRCRGRGVAGNRSDAGSRRATPGRTSAEGSSPGAGPQEMLGPSRPRPSPLPGPGVLKSFLKATPHPGDRMVPVDAPLATLLHGGIGLKGAAKASKSNGFHKRSVQASSVCPRVPPADLHPGLSSERSSSSLRNSALGWLTGPRTPHGQECSPPPFLSTGTPRLPHLAECPTIHPYHRAGNLEHHLSRFHFSSCHNQFPNSPGASLLNIENLMVFLHLHFQHWNPGHHPLSLPHTGVYPLGVGATLLPQLPEGTFIFF
ncbi:translation initiation factor IF-2-like [Felis catus]|uniref:translation initiation factor IF-2-like n=1 Tax=Felis catus TaxID=9685 RepID=UPI001D19F426|nr:translation initiation factor IF-2-like [Felis catus]